jgi:hypothetical protein
MPFVKLIGQRDNQGIQWSDATPLAVGVCFPCVVGVCSKVIEMFNVYEQTIERFDTPLDISGGDPVIISESSQRLYIACKSSVFLLTPLPLEKQVEIMIGKDKVINAFSMFEKIFQGTRKEKVRDDFRF